MDEQNQENEKIEIKENNNKKNEDILKYTIAGILVFLGAFCAFYVVADLHFRNMYSPRFYDYSIDMPKIINEEMKDFSRQLEVQNKMFENIPKTVELKQMDDKYQIYIDMKAIDNDTKNIKYKTSSNSITIDGKVHKKTKHNDSVNEFHQTYILGNKLDMKSVYAEVNKDFYIITIPLKK